MLAKKCIVVLCLILINFSNAQQNEFRAVWVASVANISWPSEPGLSSQKQRSEAIEIIKNVKDSNLNTIILQVRPQADALYESKIEPWSYFLTGESGLPPDPYYDPLKFWIDECKKKSN